MPMPAVQGVLAGSVRLLLTKKTFNPLSGPFIDWVTLVISSFTVTCDLYGVPNKEYPIYLSKPII